MVRLINEFHKVYAAQPREGTETSDSHGHPFWPTKVYAAQPREGTETQYYAKLIDWLSELGLCSSTPRGDGNFILSNGFTIVVHLKVYAAQPREGTETGEKISSAFDKVKIEGLCSSTPRGDGNL